MASFFFLPLPPFLSPQNPNPKPKPKPQPLPPLLASPSDPPGTGAAAPTRGDLFLDRNISRENAAFVLANSPKKSKKRKDKRIVVASEVACCYGCGAPLHTGEVDSPGFVDPETYELKKKHMQLKMVLCGRCKLLSHGHMVTAVGGNGGYPGGKKFISAEELREKLSHLRNEKALIVKLVDVIDFNGSFLARVRDLAGANPIILVITKIDLLPKGTDLNCIGDWVVEACTKKRLNVISVHLTSSKSLVGIAGVISEIKKKKKGRDVYILGAANVGKSAFINSMLKMMAENNPLAAAARKYKPMQSAVPGTTLGPIQIDAFQGEGKLYDTPGVHLHHRQPAVVHSEDLRYLAPQSRIRGRSFPNTSSMKVLDGAEPVFCGLSIFWGGLVRIDVKKVLPQTRLVFYGPRSLQIHTVPIDLADEFYQKELGNVLTPPTGKERAEIWSGLHGVHELKIPVDGKKRPTCDISISGLGWIAVEQIDDGCKVASAVVELHLTVHVPKPVEIFLRPPLPVGQASAEWYEYRELSDEEEELRPKWYF